MDPRSRFSQSPSRPFNLPFNLPAPVQGPQAQVPQIVIGEAENEADNLAGNLDQVNLSSAFSPGPELMFRPMNTDGIFFAILVGHCNGVAQGVNPLLECDQVESHSRQFPNYDQALGYYMAYLNLGLVRIVPARQLEPPASPGAGLNPVYIASNAPTPARVPPGFFGHPISLPATPVAVNLALLEPAPKPAAAMVEPTAKPAAKPAVKLAAKLSTKPAIPKPAAAKLAPKAGPFSGPSAATPRPYLLAPPPKPNTSPAPLLTTPTAARELAPDSDTDKPPNKLIFLGTVTVLGSDSESDELSHIPSYPSARPSTPAPTLRPFPAPSPLSSEGIPDTPIPVTPPNGKKRMVPLYDDGPFTPVIEGPTQKKLKHAAATAAAAPTSPSGKGSANRYKIIEAALSKHKYELRTIHSSPSSTRAQASSQASSTAALNYPNSPIIPSTSTIVPASITAFTAYRSIGVMSTPSTISSASTATSSTGLGMDTDLSELDSTDLEDALNL